MPRQITVKTRPRKSFPVENSDGYVLYSSLLSRMRDADDETSQHVHDTDFSSISVSSLKGRFTDSDRRYHKQLLRNENYSFQVGVTDPKENQIFESLVKPLVLGDGELQIADGTLEVEEFRSTEQSFQEITKEAGKTDDPTLEITFKTPTCIQYAGSDVTEMFPHRTSVFTSLLQKWNQTGPDELQFDLTREEIGENVIEKPDTRSLDTHSVMVNRVMNNGEPQPIFKQGFTGKCTYELVGSASKDIKNAVVSLAKFGEYSGVGSAVSRGCGNIELNVRSG